MVRESTVMAILLGVLQALLAGLAFVQPPSTNLTHMLIRGTAIVAIVLWLQGLIGFAPRLAWSVGSMAMALHVAVAFHLGHAWSHDAAMRHVEASSGLGEGIFVSHTFLAVWLCDAAWWALSPASYARRPRWLHVAVHLFLAFVVFNATVIYGHGFARWLGVFAFAVLILVRVNERGGPQPATL